LKLCGQIGSHGFDKGGMVMFMTTAVLLALLNDDALLGLPKVERDDPTGCLRYAIQ
jgi:hypothetical protein